MSAGLDVLLMCQTQRILAAPASLVPWHKSMLCILIEQLGMQNRTDAVLATDALWLNITKVFSMGNCGIQHKKM